MVAVVMVDMLIVLMTIYIGNNHGGYEGQWWNWCYSYDGVKGGQIVMVVTVVIMV